MGTEKCYMYFQIVGKTLIPALGSVWITMLGIRASRRASSESI